MNNRVFNTAFEISMRLLLTLFLTEKKGLTLEYLVTADFITNYSKEFGIGDDNLHGENEFSFSEFSTRRILAQEAIKSLVLTNLVEVTPTLEGFHYFISDRGLVICKALTSDYAKEYKLYAKKANEYMKSKTEKELLYIITHKATHALRKE